MAKDIQPRVSLTIEMWELGGWRKQQYQGEEEALKNKMGEKGYGAAVAIRHPEPLALIPPSQFPLKTSEKTGLKLKRHPKFCLYFSSQNQ